MSIISLDSVKLSKCPVKTPDQTLHILSRIMILFIFTITKNNEHGKIIIS